MAQRVLVGDDNEQMRRLIVELLVAEGYEVSEAKDTGEVLEQVSHSCPDLLVLDVQVDLAADVGADAQLPKPFRIDEFRTTVGSLLAA